MPEWLFPTQVIVGIRIIPDSGTQRDTYKDNFVNTELCHGVRNLLEQDGSEADFFPHNN